MTEVNAGYCVKLVTEYASTGGDNVGRPRKRWSEEHPQMGQVWVGLILFLIMLLPPPPTAAAAAAADTTTTTTSTTAAVAAACERLLII